MADSYSKWVMTNSFANNLQASINSGNKIEWVSIKTSDDIHLFADLAGFNDTTLATASIKQTATINAVSINGNTVTITALFNNQDNQADYYIKTLFLVAKYNGTEFLAGATVANSASTAFRMPAASATEITEFTARPQITVSNSSTISATVDPVAAATNKRVDGLEATLQGEIDDINADKQSLWNTLANYVTKAGTDTITGVKTFTQTIVGSITGNAGTSTKLATSRSIQTNLSSTIATNFDGTANVTPGVTGVLSIANGGNSNANGRAQSVGFSVNVNGLGVGDTIVGTQTLAGVQSRLFSQYTGTLPDYSYPYNLELISDGYSSIGLIASVTGSGLIYTGVAIGTFNDKVFTITKAPTWVKLATDSTVVHITGNETIAGTKTFSSPIVGSLTGNANTATKLATARTIAVTGDVTGSGTFDGSGNLSITTTESTTTRTNTTSTQAGGYGSTVTIIDGVTTNSAGEVTGVNTKTLTLPPTQTTVTGNAGSATKLATARTIGGVSFDGTANINLPGVNTAGNQSTTGNAGSATKLQTPRTIAITGDMTGSGTFDGSGDLSISAMGTSTTIALYGRGTYFVNDTAPDGDYLRLIVSGKVVSVQGTLMTKVAMSGGAYLGEALIPAQYAPPIARKNTVGLNVSSPGSKVFADVAWSIDGMLSIDNIVNGSNMTAWGTIPAGSQLSFADTWVIA